MTFVSEDEVRRCAQEMIEHIREKFLGKARLAYHGLEVGLTARHKAFVDILYMEDSFRVTVSVSKSASSRFGTNDSDFPCTFQLGNICIYQIAIPDQATADTVERKIKRLLALHLCRSRIND
jgi:hypothetical protein